MPGKLIFTTVGTSILDEKKLELIYLKSAYDDLKFELLRLNSENLKLWVQENQIINRLEIFIKEYVNELLKLNISDEVKKPPRFVNVFSAELTSLYLMSISNDEIFSLNPETDTVILLLSDSPEGVLAGLINKRYLENKNYQLLKIAIVPNLQVKNLSKFIPDGLTGFIHCIKEFGRSEPTKKAILNITGGFKSLIPYSTYLSLVYQIPMVFVFEDLPELIKINPVILNPTEEQSRKLLGINQVLREIISENTNIPLDQIEL